MHRGSQRARWALAVSFVLAGLARNAAAQTSDLVAAYSFDAGSGGSLADVSGNGNNGTITNATWTASGRFGSALVFNGSNARVQVPDSASLDLTTAVTLEAWVYPTANQANWRTIVQKQADSYLLHAGHGQGNLRPACGGTFTSGESTVTAASSIPLNTWTHLAMSYDGSAARLYVNGTQVASTPRTGTIVPTASPLWIGGNNPYGEYFNGRIDEVRVWRVARTAAQIVTDMNTSVGAPDTTPPGAPGSLGATAVTHARIDLAWTAASDNVGISLYEIDRCAGVGCSTFAPLTTTTGLGHSDLTVSPSTSYSYRVRARDTSSNPGPYATATAATPAAPDPPPSAPGSLTASAPVPTRVDLAWSAATDNAGISLYEIERCAGVGCSSFAPLTTTTGLSHADLTVVASTSYTYRVRARDTANQPGPHSTPSTVVTPAAPDTTNPGPTTGLSATAASSSRVDLTWTVASDDVGVVRYRVERCTGSACTGFAEIGTSTTLGYADLTVAASTTYRYQVRAEDAAGNRGAYSAIASATTPAPPSSIGLVAAYAFDEGSGLTSADASGLGHTVTVGSAAWTPSGKNGGALDFNGTSARATVADAPALDLTAAATLEAWVYPDVVPSYWRTILHKETDRYYLFAGSSGPGPAAGGTFGSGNVNAYAPSALAAGAWTHLASTYDGTNVRLYVNGTLVVSAPATGSIGISASPLSIGGTAAYGEYFDGKIDDVRVYNRALTQAEIQADMNTAVGAPDTTPPSAPGSFAATAVTHLRIDLSWTAATDDRGVGTYEIERCAGVGCSTFAPLTTTTTGLSHSDVTVAPLTSYSYRVRARDTANNPGPYATATAVTPAAPDLPPSAPTGLSSVATVPTRVDLAWVAAGDDVGISLYEIERCTGAGCSSFAPLSSTAATSASDATVVASTSYTYRVRARDTANQPGPYSVSSTVVTPAAPDTTPPGAPGSLGATAVTHARIDLAWTAAIDNVGISLYEIDRCAGVGCSTFAPLTTTTGLGHSDLTVSPSTSYSYRVRARDTSSNPGPYATATAATPAAPDPPPSAPGSLTASAPVPTRVDLAWSAATDNAGISLYEIERCAGVGCASFAPLTTTTGLSHADLTVVASTSYTYRVRARDTANQPGPYSLTATTVTPAPPDTTNPGPTTGLSATAASSSRVDLTWTAASDDVGVVRYRVERCTGSACTGFAEIGTSTTLGYADLTVAASTTYRYQVRAEDAAGNRGAYSAIAPATTPAPPSAVGLVAAYAFDEGSGLTSSDASGLGHTATVGSAAWTPSGKNGGALDFNGTSARATVADAPALDLTTAATLEAWVYPDVVPSYWRTILHKETDRYYLFAGSSGPGPAAGGTFGSGNVNAYAPSALAAGAWTHLASTYDGTTVRLYVNGTLVVSAAATGSIGISASPLSIGGTAAYGEYFDGKIDDVRVYNRALTQAEIQADMNTPVGSPPPVNTPQLVITAPAAGGTAAGSTLAIAYTTTGDLTGVDHVHFQIDTNPVVMDLSFDGVYAMSGVRVGSHTLRGWLVRSDHSAILGSDATPVSFTTVVDPSDPAPPQVAITAPAGGSTVSGVVAVTADASDTGSGVYGVQFRLDGVDLGAEDRNAPYGLSWNSATAANGAHLLTAVARDVAGNETVSAAVAVTTANLNPNDPAVIGQWAGPYSLPLVTVHTTLMPNGKVLFYDDHTVDAGVQVWDPVTDSLTARPYNASNLFCSAHTLLPDGRVIAVGGHLGVYVGIRDTTAFDPATETWSPLAPMTYARWYPTATSLADGRVLAVSGAEDCPACRTPGVPHPGIALIPEIYDPPTNTWSRLLSASLSLPIYPHMFLLPDGRVFASSTQEDPIVSQVLDIGTQTWSVVDPVLRDGGSSVMYRSGKILKTGTARNPDYPPAASTATAWVIDMNEPSPAWRSVPSMAFARTQHNLTSLPDGSVFVVGGGTTSDVYAVSAAIKAAEIWSPETESFRTVASMQEPRLYHSTSLLLPDGRVAVSGGGRFGPDFPSIELYSPPYLFQGARPTITSAPSTLEYGAHFAVGTPAPASIAKVTLLRLGSPTHAIDMNQRYLELAFQVAGGNLDVTAPANGNIAPPGHYMLFLVNASGVPSTAAIVRLPAPWEDAVPPGPPSSLSATGALGSMSLSWIAASDNQGVARYNVHRSTASGFAPTPANFVGFTTTTSHADQGLAPGTYRYLVTAQDAAGNVGPPSNEATGTALADIDPPTVGMTAPAAGSTVSGTVTVSANASDNGTLAGVQFLLDGAPLLAEDLTAPYEISWSTATAANGAHTLAARARDAAGNTATSTAVGVTVSNVAPSALVAAYSFDEGSGPTSADRSGNAHTLTVGGATWTTSGKTGSALSYNGTSARSTVADANGLDLSSAMTLMAWVYPNAVPSYWRTVIHKETDRYYLMAGSSSSNAPAAGGTFGSTNVNAYAGTALLAGTWNHLAATYDGTTVRLYVGGTLASSASATGNISSSASPLSIGGTAAYGEYFNGTIDDVRIYSRALSVAEIQQDMVTPVP